MLCSHDRPDLKAGTIMDTLIHPHLRGSTGLTAEHQLVRNLFS
jgi:hypothetical protein